MLTAAMKKKRLYFRQKYQHWPSAERKKVMFSHKSTFTLVKEVPKLVRRPSSASRYDPKFTVKTTKHPGSVIVWGAFKGNLDQISLYCLPKNLTMKRSIYINILIEHLCAFWKIHQCDHFIHDGAPSHHSKVVTKFLNRHNIHVLDCLVIHQT